MLALIFVPFQNRVCSQESEKVPVEAIRARLSEVQKEMTADQVRKLLGKPDRVSRIIIFRRHLEQWNFDQLGVQIEFNCLPNSEPRVLNVRLGIAVTKR